MSRFFNQSADEQSNNRLSPVPQPEQGIEQLLEELRANEQEQVVSVRNSVAPTLENFAAEELDSFVKREAVAATAAAPTSERAVVSVPMYPGRLAGSEDPLMFRAAELFRMIRTRLLRLQATQRFHSVVMTSVSASEGKTLTTANLGMCCVQVANLRVLLVDADLRTGGLSKLWNLPQAAGLADVLAGKATYDQAVATTDVPRLHIVGAGQCTLPPPELLADRKFREFLGWANSRYDLVLVDSPPILAVADYELISAACDKIILVVLARSTKRALLEKAVKHIDPEKAFGTILNASNPPQSDGYSSYAYYRQGSRSAPKTHK